MRATSSVVSRFPFVRAFVAVALVALAIPATAAGCGTEECKPGQIQPGDTCAKLCEDGGGIVENGTCIAKCDPESCVAGNTCVDNECKLICTTYKDCLLGQQDCLPATEDGTGNKIFTCQSSNKAPFATSCPNGDECTAILACPNGDACDYAQCGGAACTKDDVACAGIDNCSAGLCPDGTTSCVVPGCAQSECKPMTCISKGMGDGVAYCTIDDCKSDTDCPSSFYCGIVRDPHDICDGSMDTTMEKGNNRFCGTTTEDCIDPSTFTQGGKTFFEGSVCLLRHACVERRLCDPCTFDGACANLPDGHCADVGNEQRCVVGCTKDTDCQPDYKCDDRMLCVPRFGKCTGTGKFCEPCQNDEDCGDKTNRRACASASRNQQACLDLALPTECTADTECPKDDNGDHFSCWGGTHSPKLFTKFNAGMGELPEGLVIKGNIAYVGFAATGEIVKINISTGSRTHFGNAPDLQGGSLGFLLGLALHPVSGELYMGVSSFNAAVTPGIYKIGTAGGAATLFASDPGLTFPNGLVFDAAHNLFVTDSAAGAIYKIDTTLGTATNWLTDPTLAPAVGNCLPDTPFPIGANGILLKTISGSPVTYSLLVANTNKGQIVEVPIDPATGAAGVAAIVAGPDCAKLGGIDGLLAQGTNTLGVDNTQNKLVRIAADGTVTELATDAPLNGPASIATTTYYDGQAFITNSDFGATPAGSGLVVLQLNDNCSPGSGCGAYHTCQSCNSNDDCPASPSGLHGHCYGTPWSGDPAALSDGDLPADECVPLIYNGAIFCDGYKSCGFPLNLSSLQSGCW